MTDFARLVEIPEERLVRGIFADHLLMGSVGVPPQMRGPIQYRLHVTPGSIGMPASAFGDADAVLIDGNDYQSARAVEYKRVKVTSDSLVTGRPIGLGKLRKGVHQANQLREVGFAYVWLVVLVVADLRSLTGGRGFAGIPRALMEVVHEAVDVRRLAPGVGLSIHEIVQVSDQPANERGGSGGSMRRIADAFTQPPTLSLEIANLFLGRAT